MSTADLPRTIVAIPVKNEAERLGPCLEALDAQVGAQLDAIILLLNDCTDRSADVARAVRMQRGTRLHVIERSMKPEWANAGHARRLAMEEAARLAGPSDVLLTTDADGQVDPDWLAATLQCLRDGAEVVAGWVDLHPIEWGRIPGALHEADARECAYDRLLDEIHGLLDPDPSDPMPRHTQNSGASIAVIAAAFARCGGVPPIACGEDRALVAALRRVDARIRHAPEVHVSVSGRIEGRSQGGMADTIRRRMTQPDEFIDDRLEPATDCVRRATCRAVLRRAWDAGTLDAPSLPKQLGVARDALARLGTSPYFGEAWAFVEAHSNVLVRRPVAVADLAAQTEAARSILAGLRRAGRVGSRPLEPEVLE